MKIPVTLIMEYLSAEDASRGEFTVQWHTLFVNIDDHSRLSDLIPSIYEASGIPPDDDSMCCVFVQGICDDVRGSIDVSSICFDSFDSIRWWKRPPKCPVC